MSDKEADRSESQAPPSSLRKRAEFLALRSAPRYSGRAFLVQGAARPEGGTDRSRHAGPRFGYTVTKKTGNSVERNRIRRRLREAVRRTAGGHALPDHDYVIVARRAVLDAPFATIVADLARGLDRVGRLGANPPQHNPAVGSDTGTVPQRPARRPAPNRTGRSRPQPGKTS